MNEGLNQEDERLVGRAKTLLDRSAADLDVSTTRRLQRARLAALDAKPVGIRWTLWAGGLAMASVAALAVLLWTKQPAVERHPVQAFEELELILSPENVELAEDLEFYHWLADVDTTG